MLKNNWSKTIVGVFALAIFLFGLHPITTFDTFFGLKIGEIVATTGKVPQTEQFSWSAQGRPIVAYEWLAQTWVYLLHTMGGLHALEVYVSLMLTVFFLLVVAIQTETLNRDMLSSAVAGLFLTVGIYDFFVARPQIVAFIGLVATLYLIFAYILKSKNHLWLAIPITYIWTNSHASFIMIPFFFVSYAIAGFLYYRHSDPARGWRILRVLLVYTVITTLITLLPPLFYKPYTFLFEFSQDLPFMTAFISEWAPLWTNPAYLIFYTTVVSLSVLLSVILSVKNKPTAPRWLLALPLLAISLASFEAIRHVPLGTTTAIIFVALFLPRAQWQGKQKVLTIILYGAILLATIWLAYYKRAPIYDTIWKIPSASVDEDMANIKRMNLKGHMFNEFAIGGYFIYYLYPQYQVFFDGRADIYHNFEMRDFWPLIADKSGPADAFKQYLMKFLDKYQFSYILIPTYSYNPLDVKATTLMVNTLLDDPDWRLVYVSDFIQILVKNDGLNPELFNNGFRAITPYEFHQYRSGKEPEATLEYEQLVKMKDSAIARNALGDLYAAQNNTVKAGQEYERALWLNPEMGRADIGLGKIALTMNNQSQAMAYFHRGIALASYWGEGYILLAKTYEKVGLSGQAKQTLEEGLKQNIDFLSVRDMVTELNKLQ